MKIWIILLSLTASTLTWWWGVRQWDAHHRTWRMHLKLVVKSFIAGVAVYFALMAIALLYLVLTTH